jgi:hypothetical protein
MCLTMLVPCPVFDPLVLFLEIGGKSRAIATTVGFRGYRNTIVIRFVAWKFLEPHLSEMPKSSGRIFGALGGEVAILAGVCAYIEGIILLRDAGFGEVRNLYFTSTAIDSDVGQLIVAEAHLHRLVEIQHVDLPVINNVCLSSEFRKLPSLFQAHSLRYVEFESEFT